MRTPTDENYQRGYEWWLMEESKKRNPAIKLYGLEWGAPNWINPQQNNVWTPENITYILNWVRHAKSDHHLDIDYLGGWNERGLNAEWYEAFRAGLDKAGLNKIQIVADDSFHWDVGKVVASDAAFASSFEIVGVHYPGTAPKPLYVNSWKDSLNTGKPLWGSEIGSANYNGGAGGLAKMYNQGYIDSKMTAFINWSTIWSVLPGWPYSGDGLMLADEPWSGHYEVGLSIWATAHTTQFAQPGWQYLDGACGHFGTDPKTNGSYVALRSHDGKDFSLIVETVDAKSPQSATFQITGGLSGEVLHVWRTNLHSSKSEDWFVQQPDITPQNGAFSMSFDPACLYSLTTTSGHAKGSTTPPPSAPLALPYEDDFQRYAVGKTPRYFSDQHGAFEIAAAAGNRTGKCLRQVVTAKPVVWNRDADPGTIVGSPLWKNYRVSSDVLLEQPGYVDLIGRIMKTSKQNLINGYHLRLTDKGHWSFFCRTCDEKVKKAKVQESELASGDLATAAGINQWHQLALSFVDNNITAEIDGTVVVVKKQADSTYDSGFVGYQVSRWQNAQFMNFKVEPLEGQTKP